MSCPLHRSCLLLLTLLACARQGLPPGGPEDTAPPQVISVHPEPGATMVDPHETVTIRFGEWMDKRSLKESIFVSPIPKPAPQIQVKEKEVRIDFAEGMNLNQTYVITVGTGAKDLHGNRLKSSWTFAFSTGDRIDTGRISGQVVYTEGDVEGAYVWAYALSDGSHPDPTIDRPRYITQADGVGLYSLVFLPPGPYRLFAFQDRDRDAAYTVGQDPFGVPTGDIFLTPEHCDAGNRDFRLTVQDTIRPECVSVVAVDRIHVHLRFSEAIDSGSTESIHITSSEDGFESALNVLARYVDPVDRTMCRLVTEPQRPAGAYEVSLCDVLDTSGNTVHPLSCVSSFNGSSLPDTARPEIVATSPLDSAVDVPLDAQIEFAFNEALDTNGVSSTFRLTTIDGDEVEGRGEWPHPAILVFVPKEGLRGRFSFVATVDTMETRDVAGNRLRGSGAVLSFTTVDPETLGEISGTLEDEDSLTAGELFVQAEKIGGGCSPVWTTFSQPGPYVLPNLMPGWYHVWAFRDEDGNGRFSSGRPLPISFAERFTSYPDTVEVRSRWETQAVDMILRRP